MRGAAIRWAASVSLHGSVDVPSLTHPPQQWLLLWNRVFPSHPPHTHTMSAIMSSIAMPRVALVRPTARRNPRVGRSRAAHRLDTSWALAPHAASRHPAGTPIRSTPLRGMVRRAGWRPRPAASGWPRP